VKRSGFLAFALLSYAVFLATFTYLVAFVGGWPIVPRSIDHPLSTMPVPTAVLVDLGLVALFGVQHSVMARSGFKALWTRIVPRPIERSVYMIFASATLILMFACWQAIPAPVWDLRGSAAAFVLWAVFAAGWLIALLSTYLIDHFELFGLAQAWSAWRAVPFPDARFRQPLFYKLVRHPLYSGFLIAFWSGPVMSKGHLLFAAAMSIYILIAIEFEERDLVSTFGADYSTYRASIGKIAPWIR
jgi:methanethiol S-methyltransferase